MVVFLPCSLLLALSVIGRKYPNLSLRASKLCEWLFHTLEMVPQKADRSAPTGADPSLLVYNRRSVPEEPVACPRRKGLVLVSQSTGHVVPASCGANGCPVCGVRRALATAVAVDMAEPTRRATLTLVGDSAKEVRDRLKRFRYGIRSEGYRWEDWGAIEVNPEGTGWHWHGWQWGDFVPTRVVSRIADSKGMGRIADMRAHRPLTGSGPMYAVKAASTYGVKGALGDGDELHRWLEVNGGRHGIWSRGFFKQPYNDALRAALGRSDREGHDQGPWVLKGTAEGIVT